MWDKAFQVVDCDDGAATDVVLPGANFEVRPVGDGRAWDDDFPFVGEEGVTIELFEALHGVEKSRVGGGFHADEVGANRKAVSLVFVFAHAEVVGLDEFDELFAFDDAARESHGLAADLVQVVAECRYNLADFGIGGIVGEDDVLVPNEMTLSGFHLLRRRNDMGVLR